MSEGGEHTNWQRLSQTEKKRVKKRQEGNDVLDTLTQIKLDQKTAGRRGEGKIDPELSTAEKRGAQSGIHEALWEFCR